MYLLGDSIELNIPNLTRYLIAYRSITRILHIKDKNILYKSIHNELLQSPSSIHIHIYYNIEESKTEQKTELAMISNNINIQL